MLDESLLDPRIRGYNWEFAFQCCGPAEVSYMVGDEREYAACYNNPSVSAAVGSTAPAHPFQRIDVAEVIATSDGENDGADWIGVFRLKDERFAFLTAGCDYTGWDCQSSGYAVVSHSFDHLVQFGLGEEDRVRLNLAVGE